MNARGLLVCALLSAAPPIALAAASCGLTAVSCGDSAAPSVCTRPDASVSDCCTALLDGSPDAPSSGCFSNAECPGDARCTVPQGQNPSAEISCCAVGARGTAVPGASCTTLDECASAVCAYTPSGPVCSKACQADTDCIKALPSCVTLDAGVRFCGLLP